MKLYKLTDAQGRTSNATQWGEGITVTAKGEGAVLCSAGVVHAYTSLLLAELPDKAHGNYGAKSRWRVWQKGYALLCDINGVLYVYAAENAK